MKKRIRLKVKLSKSFDQLSDESVLAYREYMRHIISKSGKYSAEHAQLHKDACQKLDKN